MLRVALDPDHDVSAAILYLCDRESPITVDEFFSFVVDELIEHIDLVSNLIVAEKLIK